MNKTPIGVVLADVHYELNTLNLADEALNMAIVVANDFGVPVIIAGDFTTHKAFMRSEVVRRSIETLKRCKVTPIILIGNHDLDNERSQGHALEYLKPFATIIDKPTKNHIPHWTFIPYHSDLDALKAYLKPLKKHTRLIMHQGVNGTEAGEYIQDRTALEKKDLNGLTVISGHYHKGQTFELPNNGTFTYVGNPFTLNFGEANDASKGFLVLYEDGSFERHVTNLRKHMKLSFVVTNTGVIKSTSEYSAEDIKPNDLIWAVVHGKREYLNTITKSSFHKLLPVENFRLELILTDITSEVTKEETAKKSPRELFDSMIEKSTGLTENQKKRLQALWKDLI